MTTDPTRHVGLVLGGGGAVGAAYHAGALAALEHDLGWDPRRPDVIVGTSAGALVGAVLRLGVTSSDLAAISVGAPVRHTDRTLVRRLVDRPAFPPLTLRYLTRRPRLLSPRMVAGVARLWSRRGIAAFASLAMLLPSGDAREGKKSPVGCGNRSFVCCARLLRRRRDRRGVLRRWRSDLGHQRRRPRAARHRHRRRDIADDRSQRTTLALPCHPPILPANTRSRDSFARTQRDPDRCHRARYRMLEHISLDFMSETASAEIVRHAFLDTGSQIMANPALRNLSRRTTATAPGLTASA